MEERPISLTRPPSPEGRGGPESLGAAVREHVQLSGKAPCSFGIAMSKVPAKRWRTRADLYECLSRAKYRIDERISEAISLAELAAFVGISPHHFQRFFKEFFGMSPNLYQRKRRLAAARELIVMGMSVTEACFAVGFESPSTFARYFKQEFGMPPSRTART